MQYFCSQEGAEQEASGHRNVRQGGGEETKSSEGGAGNHGGVFPGLGETYRDCDDIQIPWAGPYHIWWQLAGGGFLS